MFKLCIGRIRYVRFGGIPASGRSKNHLTDEEEAGVSVYEALYRNGKYQILLPKMASHSVGTLGMCFNVAQGLYAYTDQALSLVTGKFVGYGSDGEPLLQNCKIVRQLFNDQVITDRPKRKDT